MSMFTSTLEDQLLPDTNTLEEVFPFDDDEKWVIRHQVCTVIDTGILY